MNTKQKDLLKITIIYAIIVLAGYLSYTYMPMADEVQTFLAADIVMTLVCFAFSIILRNSSVYDPYWSFIPFVFVIAWAVLHWQVIDTHHMLLFIVISLWSWRLTNNWMRSWHGMEHEDWRYVDLKNKTGKAYPLVNFFGIHLLPTLWVFGGMWPLFYIFEGNAPMEWLYFLGIATSVAGIFFEMIADNELFKFKNRPNPQDSDLLRSGIWSKSRHPNYLGELLFWFGLCMVGISFGAPWYTASGALALLILFVFISIPLKEKRMSRKPGFEAYRKEVPMLIPRYH